MSGGFRAGKTLPLLVKIITQHLTIPNNRGLIGRLTYPELRDTTQKDFFDLLPPEWIAKWKESDGELTLKNGTTVLFRNLDSVSEMEIRGMTLGFVFISQVEEIKESVYLALLARLNLQHVPCRQMMMDSNPLLFWAYKRFKQESDPSRELIEFSMLDNKENLPEDYLADMLKRPEAWKRQFVYGIWDESLLSDRSVIPIEYITEQRRFLMDPMKHFEGVAIYEPPIPGHDYQIGFDISEGVGKDYFAMSGFDCETGNQVCFFKSSSIQPDLAVTMKAVPLLRHYNTALAIPEINGCGLAFINRLKHVYDNIYKRHTFDKETDQEKEELGWKTTMSTKPLLVDQFLKLCREGQIKIRSKDVHAEMSTFVYNTDAKNKGMSAETGFHDDALISAFLGCWDINPRLGGFGSVDINFDNLSGKGRGGW